MKETQSKDVESPASNISFNGKSSVSAPELVQDWNEKKVSKCNR